MAVLLFVVVVVVGVFALRRRAKRRLVAGLVSERPAFMVEPPRRRLGDRKDGRL